MPMNIGIKMFKWFLFSLLALFFTLDFIGSSGTSRIQDSVLAALFVYQAIFIFVPEDTTLFQPIKRRSLVALITTASAMMTVLVITLFYPMIITLEHKLNLMEYSFWRVFWAVCCISWAAWSIFFFIRYRDSELYEAYRGLLSVIIKSALILLLFTWVSYAIFIKHVHRTLLLEITINSMFIGIAVLFSSIFPKILISVIFKQTKRVRT